VSLGDLAHARSSVATGKGDNPAGVGVLDHATVAMRSRGALVTIPIGLEHLDRQPVLFRPLHRQGVRASGISGHHLRDPVAASVQDLFQVLEVREVAAAAHYHRARISRRRLQNAGIGTHV